MKLIPLVVGCAALPLAAALAAAAPGAASLEQDFASPPDSARPWVYWYFMDGNLDAEGMTADLEAMKSAGIGGGIFLEVGLGMPRGPVAFMSPRWQELVTHGAREAERLGLQLEIGAGPGWCGTGGPWVPVEHSMQDLVASSLEATGPAPFDADLPRPSPRLPYFGEGTLTPQLKPLWRDFYRDEAVLAFPTPSGRARIADAEEKALYHRDPYSSHPGTKAYLPAPADSGLSVAPGEAIARGQVLDLTGRMSAAGRLRWDVPAGRWTVLRLGRTATGQVTRPAPEPGLGFESDKFDPAALDAHFAAFLSPLLHSIGEPRHPDRGWTMIHFDSWEMNSQNWDAAMRQEFTRRRGYDPLRYLPTLTGRVVDSPEISERFLWDLRETASDLVVENHADHLRDLAHQHGMTFSLEPYDMNPAADLRLGGAADVPSGEFWSKGFGYSTSYSCIEAVSVAHTNGRPIVAAEAFTGESDEAWQQYPGSMKDQTDWALCAGLNRLVIHRFQAQPRSDQFPGMTMGPYGVHWDRTETWWDMVPAYHAYLTRCQALLRRGLPVADVLYVNPEGAPVVFRPPASALAGDPFIPDRRGYNFDGCDPVNLIEHATVQQGRVAFPGGMSYAMLFLPHYAMTPRLLRKVLDLVRQGVQVVGIPPSRSPSLSGYPACDDEVHALAAQIWEPPGDGPRAHRANPSAGLYPDYEDIARLTKLPPDFDSDANVRYTHRHEKDAEIYFVANREAYAVTARCTFRVFGGGAEIWDPLTGERSPAAVNAGAGGDTVDLPLAAFGSAFVIFRPRSAVVPVRIARADAEDQPRTIGGPWQVAFDPRWGGPADVTFDRLQDWSQSTDAGIRYYSGRAVYRTTFAAQPTEASTRLNLGSVAVMAQVKLNGRDLGVVWCAPWAVTVPGGLLRASNTLEIKVANLWVNRLIADSGLPAEKRLTITTWNPYHPTSPLKASGLLGPVTLSVPQSP